MKKYIGFALLGIAVAVFLIVTMQPKQDQKANAPAQKPVPKLLIESLPVAKFTFEADDMKFYPYGAIQVQKGTDVTVTLKVRISNVSDRGLEFRGPKFSTGTVKAGESTIVNFVADQTFEIISYGSVSKAEKARLGIFVQ